MTPEQLAAEPYSWIVRYDDGTVLREADPCPEHPGHVHAWACVDMDRAVAVEFAVDAGPTVRVDCSAPGTVPVFFRRRVRQVKPAEGVGPSDNGDGTLTVTYEDDGARLDLATTWLGYRGPAGESYIVALADGTLELRADTQRVHGA